MQLSYLSNQPHTRTKINTHQKYSFYYPTHQHVLNREVGSVVVHEEEVLVQRLYPLLLGLPLVLPGGGRRNDDVGDGRRREWRSRLLRGKSAAALGAGRGSVAPSDRQAVPSAPSWGEKQNRIRYYYSHSNLSNILNIPPKIIRCLKRRLEQVKDGEADVGAHGPGELVQEQKVPDEGGSVLAHDPDEALAQPLAQEEP